MTHIPNDLFEPESAHPTRDFLERIKSGDRQALNELISHFYPELETFARSEMGARFRAQVEVEDVLQEVFKRAYEKLAEFEPGDSAIVRFWLMKLVNWVIAEMARGLNAEKRGGNERIHSLEAPTDPVDPPAPSSRASASLSKREHRNLLADCIGEVKPEKNRRILQLRYMLQMKMQVIVREMELPSVDAGYMLLNRAEEKLAEILKRRGVAP